MKKNQKFFSLIKVSEKTERTLRVWLKGRKEDLKVYRIPIKHLYFNIENGRYADKMLQLKANNPGADIDPKKDIWKAEILKMLKGEYKGSIEIKGTEEDKSAFERLQKDIDTKEQLTPGIVLSDGGVIDGNRRLAVLMSLTGQRFSHFDGAILPEDTSREDRWRIEVGMQLGKDEKLDYSPINKLLKIREGVNLYKSEKTHGNKTSEELVAEALYGVDKNEVIENIERMHLIDEYLEFFNFEGQYHLVSDKKGERFIEVLKTLKASEKLKPYEKAKLKAQLFVIINENLMTNWDIRDIRKSLGGGKSKGRKSIPIPKAINHLIKHGTDPNMIRKAYMENKIKKVVDKANIIVDEFKDIYEAEKDANRPLVLAKAAKTKLETLKNSLKDFNKEEDAITITAELTKMKKLIRVCFTTIKIPKRKSKKVS